MSLKSIGLMRGIALVVLVLGLLAPPSAADPVVGEWSDVLDWPIVAIHLVQLHTGEILVWSSHQEQPHVLDPSGGCFDTSGGCFTEKPIPVDIFCSGHTHLDDGTVIVNGGHIQNNVGEEETFLFQHDKETDEWNWSAVGEIEDTDFARWYPTLTTLADGRVLNMSGSRLRCDSGPDAGDLCREHADCAPAETENCTIELVAIPELFDPVTRRWSQLSLITDAVQFYPFNFVDPNGDVFFAGADVGASGFDIPPTQSATFDVVNEAVSLGDISDQDGGSAVMYDSARILKTGGTSGSSTAIADAEIIDLDGAATWLPTNSMNIPRRRHNLTVLPDGTVLVTGGTRLGNREFEIDRTCGGTDDGDSCNRDSDCSDEISCVPHSVGDQMWVSEAEIWNPQTGTWTVMAGNQVPRMYHSTATLLPDGRVVSAGGGRGGGAVRSYRNAEVFSPPYLFTGTPRPVIDEAPEIIHYGQSFEVQSPEADDVDRVSLIRLASVTHSFDQNRRFVPLTFGQQGDTELAIDAPSDPAAAPPGWYMLFLVSEEGVPSVARFVRLLPADPGADATHEYSAKMVCGSRTQDDEFGLTPGRYETTVNIHNPGPGATRFFKKLALTFPPGNQRAGEILPIGIDELAYDEALHTDCRELRRRLVPTDEAALIEGFLVIQSQASLDVTAVYTTAVLDANGAPSAHSSIDIERIEERARGNDLRIDKRVLAFPPFQVNDNIALYPLLYTVEVDNLGPGDVMGLRVDDDLTLQAVSGLGAIGVVPAPIDLPPGGQIVDIVQNDFTSVSFALELGDLAAGASVQARFWAMAILVDLPTIGASARVVVRNVATVGAEGPELSLLNNKASVETEVP